MFKGNWWDKTLAWALTIAFMIMVTATIAQVVFRYFLHHPLGWTEELARITFVWSMFISIAILAKNKKLMFVEILVTAIPSRVRGAVLGVIYLVSALGMGFLGYEGIRLVGFSAGQVSPALNVPYPYIYVSLPLGCLLATFYLAVQSFEEFRHLFTGRNVVRAKEEQAI